MKAHCAILLIASLLLAGSVCAQEPGDGYNPEPGLFINVIDFNSPSSSGPYNFYCQSSTAFGVVYHLLYRGTFVKRLEMPKGSHCSISWMFFPRLNYLVVRHATTMGFTNFFNLYVIQLGGSYPHYRLGEFSGVHASLTLNPSQDGEAFFIFVGLGNNTSHTHRIIRTSNGNTLCEMGHLYQQMWQRLAEITVTRMARISVGPHLHVENRLPND